MKFTLNNNEGYGVDMRCVLTFAAPPPEDELKSVKELIHAWYTVGLYGMFDGYVHYLGDLKQKDEKTYEWFVDMGSSDIELAFEALKGLLEEFNQTDRAGLTQEYVKIDHLEAGD